MRAWMLGGTRVPLLLVVLLLASALAVPFSMDHARIEEPSQPSEWHLYTVDTGEGVGAWSALSLDSKGYPHISYMERRPDMTHFLKYARWTGENWSIEVVDPHSRALWFHSNAVDSQDNPHIAYDADNSLKYAVRNESGWMVETVDHLSTVGDFASIAIDSKDNPHISYFDQHNDDLRYANKTGGKWKIETVDSQGFVGWHTSLALDEFDLPHIAYTDVSNWRPKYARRLNNGWSMEPIDAASNSGTHPSLALDARGLPRVAYFNSVLPFPTYLVKLAWNNGSKWETETVDQVDTSYIDMSLAPDGQDNPHISHHDVSQLKYMRRTGGVWSIEVVDDALHTGRYTSLAIDADDNPHISYQEYVYKGGKLRYATKAHLEPPPEPVLALSLNSLDLGTLSPGAGETASFEIWNSGNGTLTYSLNESTPWIVDVDPASGNSTGERDIINVTVDTAGLPEGSHTGAIVVETNGGEGVVLVSVEVIALSRSITLDIDPDTLNLKSKGRWITAYLSAENASVHDMDISTILLQDALAPERWDYQDDVLMLKFDRQEFKDTVQVGESVQVKIIGKWDDGTAFEAYDSIRVIEP